MCQRVEQQQRRPRVKMTLHVWHSV
jgi:hypothetical protein